MRSLLLLSSCILRRLKVELLLSGMARLIVQLLNMSISSATFPVLQKRAIVTPVQNSLKSAALTIFHPISVLPIMSKLAP